MILVVTVIYVGVTSLFVMSLALAAARPMPEPEIKLTPQADNWMNLMAQKSFTTGK